MTEALTGISSVREGKAFKLKKRLVIFRSYVLFPMCPLKGPSSFNLLIIAWTLKRET